MSASALFSRLEATLKSAIEDQGLKLSPYSEQRVRNMVSIGVERMSLDNVIEKQEKVYLAEENVNRLVEYLSDQAKAYGSFPHMEDLAFDMALAECFPLWPFV